MGCNADSGRSLGPQTCARRSPATYKAYASARSGPNQALSRPAPPLATGVARALDLKQELDRTAPEAPDLRRPLRDAKRWSTCRRLLQLVEAHARVGEAISSPRRAADGVERVERVLRGPSTRATRLAGPLVSPASGRPQRPEAQIA